MREYDEFCAGGMQCVLRWIACVAEDDGPYGAAFLLRLIADSFDEHYVVNQDVQPSALNLAIAKAASDAYGDDGLLSTHDNDAEDVEWARKWLRGECGQ